MADLDIDTALGWRDRTVHDREGEKIGTFGDVFLERDTQRPAWGGVRTGLFGRKESYVPLDGVEETEDGLRVPHTKDEVKDAPNVDPDVALTSSEEQSLYAHYGRDYAPGDDAAEEQDTDAGAGAGDGMTRSEEEVRVSAGPMRPAERVRLRKVLVTEHQTRTVPVQREVVEVEQEPTGSGTDDAPAQR